MGFFGIYPRVNKQFANWKMIIDIVDFPSKMVFFFHSYVKLPEGKRSARDLGHGGTMGEI